MFVVVVTEKGGNKETFEFDEEIISIGRVQGNDVVLPRGNVSKRHSKFEYKGGRFFVSDSGSTNGTYVNGRRIQEPTPISPSDKIYVGDYILTVEESDTVEPPTDTDAEPMGVLPPTEGTKPLTLAEPPDRADPQLAGSYRPRISAPSVEKSARRSPDGPRESHVPLPRPGSESATAAQETEPGESTLETKIAASKSTTDLGDLGDLVGTILEQVARRVKRVKRANAPIKMDSGTAGTVRIAVDELVSDYVARGKLPTSINPDLLKGSVFRAAVDLGPLGDWLEDDGVERIRITKPEVISLFKNGEWVDAPRGFLGPDDLDSALRCLEAGLEVRDTGVPGVSRYRLDEGYWVYAALPPGAASGPAVVIDKTFAPEPAFGHKADLTEAALKIIKDALEARAKIAVMGGSGPARLAVLSALVEMLPEDDFVVALEDLPLAARLRNRSIRFSSRAPEGQDSKGRLNSLLFHALMLEPTWLVIAGTGWRDIPDLLGAVMGNPGVIADLPLGGAGQINHELAVVLASAGGAVSPSLAATILGESFDIIILTARNESGAASIDKVLACTVSEKGGWSPKTLFDHKQRS